MAYSPSGHGCANAPTKLKKLISKRSLYRQQQKRMQSLITPYLALLLALGSKSLVI
jgi:flagellar biosynthesis chaperone FliJ